MSDYCVKRDAKVLVLFLLYKHFVLIIASMLLKEINKLTNAAKYWKGTNNGLGAFCKKYEK